MPLDPRIALAGQGIDVGAALQTGMDLARQQREDPIRMAILRQQQQLGQQGVAAGQMAAQQAQQQQAAQSALGARKFAQQLRGVDDYATRQGMLQQYAPQLAQMGIDASQLSPEDLTDEGLDRFLAQTQFLAPKAQLPAGIKDIDPTKYTPESVLMYQQSGNLGVLVPIDEEGGENLLNIQKETRGEIRGVVGDLSKEASVLNTNYEKLQNLTDEMRKGNRAAVSQGLVALVKLGDPTSVVREAEMEAALNKQNPVAAITSLLTEKGTNSSVIGSIIQKIDPLNPANINVDDLLSTANAMLAPNIQSIQSRYGEAKLRADENLTPEGIKSIFTGGIDTRVAGLGALVPKQAPISDTLTTPSGIQYRIVE